ncbi:DUF6049 family protein [Aeromicrobium ginsengisoli]|uniref:Uncharacterized protein n=1 Tax=Aeromicrobium ginsengisoli TaxID=363867 RepID=A0A5M4FBR6_9ACTN|nr:DUF6049 family protein [Aeromicrobium ginsengisoli]KAA1395709.1 hypothetical protein ESP70_016330 [Aeromicrobium ginsengisoli]
MSSPRRRVLVALLATILATLTVPGLPAHAADKNPQLSVSIQSLSPSRLGPGSTVTMTGTVTNHNGHAWTNVQAYLVIPAVPFTTRSQVEDAIDNGDAYTGVRVVDAGTFDDLGDLAPKQTRRFSVKVPYDQLHISGAEGVYPVGVQILGTDTGGERSNDAIARATTFLPLVSGGHQRVAASVVWPFLMPNRRGYNGDYVDTTGLLRDVSAGGQLRNLLDLASSTSDKASTALIDPALLVGVDDLIRGHRVPEGVKLTPEQKAEAQRFLDDLLAFARRQGSWVLGFDRPDVLALSNNPDLETPLKTAIDRATDAALTKFQLYGREVSWPSMHGVTSSLLRDLRGSGDSPVIVTSDALPSWDRRLGSVVQYVTPNGPMPLLVTDVLDAGVPGQDSVVTLRQRILSEAALATLQREIDPKSRADAITMVDPRWNPGPQWAAGRLSAAFEAPFTSPTSLESMLTRPLTSYSGKVAAATDRPLSRAQLKAAARIVASGSALSSVIPQSDEVDDALAQDVASVLGIRWRESPGTGTAIAKKLAGEAGAELRKITIKAPSSVTLSSSKGGFPITIRNDTGEAIRVGVTFDSSNPALTVPDVKPIDIGAGERHTLTVDIDLGRQNATSLTAHLKSTDGKTIGQPADPFNVRSSKIGVVLWVAMGLAALLVLAALVRRFSRRRRRTRVASERPADDDD